MSDIWEKLDTWVHVKKAIALIVAMVLFFPIDYFLLLPIIGNTSSILIYVIFLFIVGYIIRIKIKENY